MSGRSGRGRPSHRWVRFETPPGYQGQVDFGTFALPWGRRHALLIVLGYSRLLWLQFFPRQTMAVLIRGLEAAFTSFGGVPQELLFDQMRSVVTADGRPDAGGLMMNAEFLRFAEHWGFRARACRPYRAQTKGKVERPIRYCRQSFFYGRTFVGDDDLNAQAAHWCDTVANVRQHRTTGEPPQRRFARGRARAAPAVGRAAVSAPRHPRGHPTPPGASPAGPNGSNTARCASIARPCDDGRPRSPETVSGPCWPI